MCGKRGCAGRQRCAVVSPAHSLELKPTDLILRRRTDLGFTRDRHIKYASRLEPTCGAPSRRMAAGSVSLVAVLRDARNPSRRAPQVGHARLRMTCALLRTRLIE